MPDDKHSGERVHRDDQEQIDLEAEERERERAEEEERERGEAEEKESDKGKDREVYRPRQLIHAVAEAQALSTRAVRGTVEQRLDPVPAVTEAGSAEAVEVAPVEVAPVVGTPAQAGKVEDPWKGGRSPAERFGGGNQHQTPALGGAPPDPGAAAASPGESWSPDGGPPAPAAPRPAAPLAFDWLRR